MDIKNILMNLPEFSEFTPTEIQTIVENLDNKNLLQDCVFVHEGIAYESLFILIKGTVTVFRESATRADTELLGQLKPGALIGLGSLLGAGIAAASCKTQTKIVIASLPFKKYNSMCKHDKNINCKFQFTIAKQLANEMKNYNQYLLNSLGNINNESSLKAIYSCEYRGLERRQVSRRMTERRKNW